MTSNEGEQELPSFDIFDKNKVEEYRANPDGSKFPIAFFSFYENGTIEDIKFQESTDEYNLETLKELVEKVIPKLSRNRTEDNANGLNIKTRTDRKKKTLIEEVKPKQYLSFKGSKYSKTLETNLENDEITDIHTRTDIDLLSNPEEDEQIYGPKAVYAKQDSLIIAKGTHDDYPFDDDRIITDLRPIITDGNRNQRGRIIKEAFKKIDGEAYRFQTYDFIKGQLRVKGNDGDGENSEEEKDYRRLGYSISADQTFTIGKYNVLGQTVTVKYHVAVKNGKPINEIIIDSKLGTTKIGNIGVSLKGSWSKTITIFKFAFPAFPLVSINAKAKGKISWAVSATSGSGSSVKLSASLGGKISLCCEVKAGWDAIASFSGGVEGTIVNASGSATIQNKKVTKNFSISGGKIVIYLDRSVFKKKKRVAEKTLFNGW